jgi:hypothetical protein
VPPPGSFPSTPTNTNPNVGKDVRTIITLAAETAAHPSETASLDMTSLSESSQHAAMLAHREPKHATLPLSYLPSSVSLMVAKNVDEGVVDISASHAANSRARPEFKRDTSYAAVQVFLY